MTKADYGIVAAYDGSPSGAEALRWAAREARARHSRLTLFLASDLAPPGEQAPHDLARLARQRGKLSLADGLDYAESVIGSGQIQLELTDEPPDQALCKRSTAAEMIVLGAHGYSTLPGLLLGAVPSRVAAHGHGRIVVVRGQWLPVNTSPGPVVAGVDGSAASADALTFAFEEASLRDVPLMAVCALADAPGVYGGVHRMETEFAQEMTRQEEDHPGVAVIRQVVAGTPRYSLLAAASGAQMIVVGSRGRGGFKGILLGSVAQTLLHHSPCPVGIVHPGPRADGWRPSALRTARGAKGPMADVPGPRPLSHLTNAG